MPAKLAASAALLVLALILPAEAVDAPARPAVPAGSLGSYAWPVHGPVLRRFEPPPSPYGSGHRGIDIGAEVGMEVRAAEGGVVAFSGHVGGELHVSIDHPDGIRTTYSFLESVRVRAGDAVFRGAQIGSSGPGHAGASSLHFGARYEGEYVDPMLLLEPTGVAGLIRLAPLEPEG